MLGAEDGNFCYVAASSLLTTTHIILFDFASYIICVLSPDTPSPIFKRLTTLRQLYSEAPLCVDRRVGSFYNLGRFPEGALESPFR